MKYINQLQNENTELKAEVEALREGLANIRGYLNLPKFGVDVMVNKSDIFLRIEETLQNADRAKDDTYCK